MNWDTRQVFELSTESKKERERERETQTDRESESIKWPKNVGGLLCL